MKCFSMFTGIGGFDLALRRLGHDIVGACEIDPHARSVFKKQFPGVQVHNDATNLHPQSLPHIDVLSAGFPCQAFSIAGRRRGFDDTRGSLFFEIARIAKEKRPSYLLLENVKGLLSHDKGKHSEPSLAPLMKWGMMQNGNCLTANISFHKTGNVSSLSDILEENVPDKYFLSETSTANLISRNQK
jgi:DNA (cytosine-5)-methyltransferase 1